jgi:phenylalanyl-tRNA synthetase beta chain
MKVPIRWLADYVEVDTDEASVVRLAERLTLAGLEVEEISKTGTLRGVLVGRVETCCPHPDSDHLSLCTVATGSETVEVVCGAPNVRAGILAPIALVGAELPSGFRIERRKVRGKVSNGMICSRAELGLEDHSEGIWIFDPRLELSVGTDMATLLEVDDFIFDIKITSNRPDCASIVGVAREVAALLDRPLRPLDVSVREDAARAADRVKVSIESAHDAPRYAARVMEDVRVGPSPLRIQHRLLKAGMRPVSNVVDATNLTMIELGQPLHPFDADRIEGTIGVRRAKSGEVFRTLDGADRTLDTRALLITDQDRPIALAGIMGGEASEITEETKRVLIEIAVFHNDTIRQSSRALGLRSEASQRFERGLDPDSVPAAAARAAHWMQTLSGCRVLAGLADAYPAPAAPRTIELRPARARELLGIDVDADQVASLLARLQIGARVHEGIVRVDVPSFRRDLEREADLVEEVGRIHGYDRLTSKAPRSPLRIGRKDAIERGKDRVRELLVGLGMDEVLTDGFDKRTWREALGMTAADLVAVRNPMAATQASLRGSLLPGALSVVETNLRHGVDGGMIFEVGRVFSLLHGERDALGGAFFGRTGLPLSGKERVSLALARGLLDRLLDGLRLNGVTVAADGGRPYLHPGRSARFVRGDVTLGFLGEIHPHLVDRLAVPTTVHLFEFELLPLLVGLADPVRYQPLPTLPAAKRDLSMLTPADLDEARVRAVLSAEPEVESVLLYDVYTGDQVGADRRSLTYEISLRAVDRTLTDPEIAVVVERIAHRLGELDVRLRAA